MSSEDLTGRTDQTLQHAKPRCWVGWMAFEVYMTRERVVNRPMLHRLHFFGRIACPRKLSSLKQLRLIGNQNFYVATITLWFVETRKEGAQKLRVANIAICAPGPANTNEMPRNGDNPGTKREGKIHNL